MPALTIYFIRHGLSASNERGLLCGSTDALLSEQGREDLKELKRRYPYPSVDRLYVSPAIRCRETAALLFPDTEQELAKGFWEFDFGCLESRPLSDIAGTPVYKKWLAQDPDFGAPGGETLLEAQFRVMAALTRMIMDCVRNGYQTVAVVAHGEIFSLLIQKALRSDQALDSFLLTPNGMGFVTKVDPEVWFLQQKMDFLFFFPPDAPRPRPEDSPYFCPEND